MNWFKVGEFANALTSEIANFWFMRSSFGAMPRLQCCAFAIRPWMMFSSSAGLSSLPYFVDIDCGILLSSRSNGPTSQNSFGDSSQSILSQCELCALRARVVSYFDRFIALCLVMLVMMKKHQASCDGSIKWIRQQSYRYIITYITYTYDLYHCFATWIQVGMSLNRIPKCAEIFRLCVGTAVLCLWTYTQSSVFQILCYIVADMLQYFQWLLLAFLAPIPYVCGPFLCKKAHPSSFGNGKQEDYFKVAHPELLVNTHIHTQTKCCFVFWIHALLIYYMDIFGWYIPCRTKPND